MLKNLTREAKLAIAGALVFGATLAAALRALPVYVAYVTETQAAARAGADTLRAHADARRMVIMAEAARRRAAILEETWARARASQDTIRVREVPKDRGS